MGDRNLDYTPQKLAQTLDLRGGGAGPAPPSASGYRLAIGASAPRQEAARCQQHQRHEQQGLELQAGDRQAGGRFGFLSRSGHGRLPRPGNAETVVQK
jgi:hypothetical protein